MIPILAEPSSFIYKIGSSSDKQFNLKDFRDFILKLNSFLDELEVNQFKIAATTDLVQIYMGSVPIPIYEQPNNPIVKMAKGVIYAKLRRLLKIIHEYGEHNLEYSVDVDSIDHTKQLHEMDVYLHSFDLISQAFFTSVPSVILKSEQISIFNNNFFILKNETDSIKIDVAFNIPELIANKDISGNLLSQYFKEVDINTIPCHGTGTHSSMWGHSIRSIRDIPYFERELIITLFNTGIVKSLKFLDFSNKYPTAEEPFIEVKQITTEQNCDLIMGVLRGNGVKQNGQKICIETIKGTGILLVNSLGSEIVMETLNFLSSQVAATVEEY